jgi:hypothetical protein
MKLEEYVVVHLVNPREKFWGILRELSPAGATVRGLSLDSFEGWLREVARKEPVSFTPATVFFPLHRIERVFEDETMGEIVSFADRFRKLIGEDPRYHLTPIPDTT